MISHPNTIPLSSGDDTLAYVQQGEVIIPKDKARMLGAGFFRDLNLPGFNNGGVVGGYTNMNIQSAAKIDYDILAVKIGEQVGKANVSLPSPVVEVSTITEAQTTQNRIQVNSSL